MQQVIKNLLSNAFKFTDSGGVKLRIGLAEGRQFASEALSRAEAVLEFTVVDTGVGIPHDQLRLIFEAFQQADGTTSRRYGGTGLGLSISRGNAASRASSPSAVTRASPSRTSSSPTRSSST